MSGSDDKSGSDSGSSTATTTKTFPAAMPGQLEAISAQLGAGYGTDPAALLAYMQQFYAPMTATIPTTATSGTTGTASSGSSSSGSSSSGKVTRVVHNRDGTSTYYDAAGNVVEGD